jgi:hypothetical protein
MSGREMIVRGVFSHLKVHKFRVNFYQSPMLLDVQ